MTDQQQEEPTIDSILGLNPTKHISTLPTPSPSVTPAPELAQQPSPTITTLPTIQEEPISPSPAPSKTSTETTSSEESTPSPGPTQQPLGPDQTNPSRFAGFNSRSGINSSRIVETNPGSEGTTERSEVGTTRTRNTTPSVLESNPAVCEPRCGDLN